MTKPEKAKTAINWIISVTGGIFLIFSICCVGSALHLLLTLQIGLPIKENVADAVVGGFFSIWCLFLVFFLIIDQNKLTLKRIGKWALASLAALVLFISVATCLDCWPILQYIFWIMLICIVICLVLEILSIKWRNFEKADLCYKVEDLPKKR